MCGLRLAGSKANWTTRKANPMFRKFMRAHFLKIVDINFAWSLIFVVGFSMFIARYFTALSNAGIGLGILVFISTCFFGVLSIALFFGLIYTTIDIRDSLQGRGDTEPLRREKAEESRKEHAKRDFYEGVQKLATTGLAEVKEFAVEAQHKISDKLQGTRNLIQSADSRANLQGRVATAPQQQAETKIPPEKEVNSVYYNDLLRIAKIGIIELNEFAGDSRYTLGGKLANKIYDSREQAQVVLDKILAEIAKLEKAK